MGVLSDPVLVSVMKMYNSVVLPAIIAVCCLVACAHGSALAWESRIIGGTNATGSACPYTVSIRLVGKDFLCNGALITSQDVLTAAQCVYNGNTLRNASEFQVIVGTSVNSNNFTGATVRTVLSVWPNSQFNVTTRANDIVVLRLNATVPSSVVSPVLVGTTTPPVNRTCSVCGWGANAAVGQPLANLQKLDVTVQPSNSTHCVRTAGGITLREDMLCVGDLLAGRGACTGDVGAPLVCDGKLQGVLSLVGGCGAVNETSIYTNTVVHASWISNRTAEANPQGNDKGTASHLAVQFGLLIIALMCSLA